ncbi:MAG: SGNH/GDSL hydrolase family protein [Streptosporangiaceae bacterium]
MAKHRRSPDQQTPARPRRRTIIIGGSTLAVTLALCLAGSLKLFASASTVADSAHGASLRGSRHARLIPPPTAGAKQASGGSVTAVGDSIMVASTPALQAALPGIYIDAAVGRQFSTGLQVIADLKAQGMLRPIVVVGLGTNGTVTAGEISQLFAEIGPDRKLVLVNTFENRPWEQEVNSMLATAANEHRGVVLADWYTKIEHRTSLLWPDGIHPQPAGAVVYAKLLKAALVRLVNLRA